MNAKEKAKELVEKYWKVISGTDTCLSLCNDSLNCQYSWYQCKGWLSYSKLLAKIAVEEIIKTFLDIDPGKDFWVEVLKEIDLL